MGFWGLFVSKEVNEEMCGLWVLKGAFLLLVLDGFLELFCCYEVKTCTI